MIAIDRSREPAPAILSKEFPDSPTPRDERQRAIDFYEDPNWNGKSFSYGRYSEDSVKDALQRLCHGKCAYCEIRLRTASWEDVEHWRPKNAVILNDGSEHKPGYYWLGAEWTNLLPSCQHCNRRSRHDDVRDDSIEQTGKQSLFPVDNEADRWLDRTQPDVETPLLLDPTEDDPSRYLRIDEGAVIHEKQAEGLDNLRAKESIEIYGLNRVELVTERQEHRARVVSWIRDVKRELRRYDRETDPEEKRESVDVIKEKLAFLKQERADTSPYLFMKKPLIDDFTKEFGGDLRRVGAVAS